MAVFPGLVLEKREADLATRRLSSKRLGAGLILWVMSHRFTLCVYEEPKFVDPVDGLQSQL